MIVFLDIDGTINTHEQCQVAMASPSRCHPIDRQCMSNLATLLMETGAYCVLTSSWRYIINSDRRNSGRDLDAFEFMLRTHGFPEGRLLSYTCRDEEISGRGHQIAAWLVDLIHYGMLPLPETPYVVLDDMSPDLESMSIHPLVTTNCHVGLTEADAERAIALLRMQTTKPWSGSLISVG